MISGPGLALRSQAHSCRDNSDITSSVSTSPFASKAVNECTMRFIASLDDASLEAFMSLEESCQTVGGSLSHVIVLRNNHPGQIDYLRDLQEEDLDLPLGTGDILS